MIFRHARKWLNNFFSDIKLPRVPESVLKKRKQTAAGRSKAVKADTANRKKQAAAKKRTFFKRAEKFVKEYRAKERDAIRLARLAKRNVNVNVPAESGLVFVIRIRGVIGIHQRPRKVLQLFKLRQINTGIFLKLNKATLSMLKIAEPYLTWGVPSLKTVREVIYKRGYGKVDRKKVPLTDNSVIEKELGDKDIICMEDLIHEIMTLGPNFKYATNFLMPFKMSPPLCGWRRKYRHFKDGGSFGDRGTAIDALVKQMI
ncbi:unnamed protein product [Candidula unifasciata]|uniref:60S ribosomal protein L7 n=1 Tax=Candidula unifasciata TaxID=100452 RepID=A0A8S3YF28_9EUPU|nr:unnamed protein product [Candidula unifasciata]